MNKKRKRIVIFASCVVGLVVLSAISINRPKRDIVIDADGSANRDYEAFLIVDGQRHTETVTLPKTFRFHAREVSYRITPADEFSDGAISGHMYTANKWIDFSCTGWAVGGRIKSPSVVGFWSGDFEGFSGGPEDSTEVAESD